MFKACTVSSGQSTQLPPPKPNWNQPHTIHLWYIHRSMNAWFLYGFLVGKYTIHGCYGNSIRDQKKCQAKHHVCQVFWEEPQLKTYDPCLVLSPGIRRGRGGHSELDDQQGPGVWLMRSVWHFVGSLHVFLQVSLVLSCPYIPAFHKTLRLIEERRN